MSFRCQHCHGLELKVKPTKVITKVRPIRYFNTECVKNSWDPAKSKYFYHSETTGLETVEEQLWCSACSTQCERDFTPALVLPEKMTEHIFNKPVIVEEEE
jgi:hypothetical protein